MLFIILVSKKSLENSALGKVFSLQMSSNTNSEENLKTSGHRTLSSPESPYSGNLNTQKSAIMRLKASVSQRENQIETLNKLNTNLKQELKLKNQLEDELKAEILQYKERTKDLQSDMNALNLQKGKDKISVRKLNTQVDDLSAQLRQGKENYNVLSNEVEDLRVENENLKATNLATEKEKYLMQTHIDKLNRMLSRASADSKRYKSVVDLQKSAINDLQKDYNKAIIDLSHSANFSDSQNFTMNHEKSVNNTENFNRSEKKTFTSAVLNKLSQKATPEKGKLGRNQSIVKNSKSLYSGYMADSKKNITKEHFENLSGKEGPNNLQDFPQNERTFDNAQKGRYHKDFEGKYKDNYYQISLTEEADSDMKFESKRISTENFIQISPESCSPEMASSQNESFVSNSTAKNSKKAEYEIDLTQFQKSEKFRRSRSRRDSRILIQALPRLRTKSKYEDFRGAKSIDRRPTQSSKNNISSLKALKPGNSIVETSQRLTKVSNNYSSQDQKSAIFSPTTCDKTKRSGDNRSSVDNTYIRGAFSSSKRDSVSSSNTISKKPRNFQPKNTKKSFRKYKKSEKIGIRYPTAGSVKEKHAQIKSFDLQSVRKYPIRKEKYNV